MIRSLTYALGLAIAMLLTTSGFAQSTSDSDLSLGYEPLDIVNEWDAWHQSPTSENAFIGEFMEEFQVPQSGQNGLNRREVWYWWVSHHPSEVNEYIDRRDQEQGAVE